MKINDIIIEQGVIVQGVNTTVDVKTGETERQAKKFFGGNGTPKPLTDAKSNSHILFNLGLSESVIDEITAMEAPVKQSDVVKVIHNLAMRKDDNPFQVRFYNGAIGKIRPSTAKKVISFLDRIDTDEVRDRVMQYISTINGFKEIAQKAGVKLKEERMISELDPKFDTTKPSNYKAAQTVNSQSNSGPDGKNRTKQIGSTFTQTQGDKQVGFDKFNADSKIGGVQQRNSVKGIHRQDGDQFAGTVRSTDNAAQGIDKDKFKTATGYDREGLKKARKAEYDKTTTKQKLKYSDKGSYQSGLGIEKDVADLKNMFNN